MIAETTGPLWPLVVYALAVILLVAAMLTASHLLGQRRPRPDAVPYESGMMPTGSARLRFSANFYLIAMFFVIFDVESVFVFAWAIAVRELGWLGYVQIVIFVGVLVLALVYLWRSGALDWVSPSKGWRNDE